MCSFTQVKNDNCGALLLFGLVELEMNFVDYLTTDRSELELIPLICYNGRAGKSLTAELGVMMRGGWLFNVLQDPLLSLKPNS